MLNPETLSVHQSKKVLKRLGLDVKSEDIHSFLNDGEEELDAATFLQFTGLKLIQTEKAEKAFNLMDTDNKGVVVMEDLQRIAKELGEDFSEQELIEMIEFVDRSGDGMLRPKDFVRIARKVNLWE